MEIQYVYLIVAESRVSKQRMDESIDELCVVFSFATQNDE
jgi:hypothetical protein